jgi:transposase-like protein
MLQLAIETPYSGLHESWADAPRASMKHYSADVRERLLSAIDAGRSQAEASRIFGVWTSTITRWRQRRAATGAAAASRDHGSLVITCPTARRSVVRHRAHQPGDH